MTGISEGAAAFGVLKSAYEFVRDLRKSNDPATLRAGVEELTDRLLAAREDALRVAQDFDALAADNQKLRDELKKRQTWEQEASRYRLAEIFPSNYAYALRAEKRGDDPDHMVCAVCFKAEKISILQKLGHANLKCHTCGMAIQAEAHRPSSVNLRRPGRSSWME